MTDTHERIVQRVTTLLPPPERLSPNVLADVVAMVIAEEVNRLEAMIEDAYSRARRDGPPVFK